MTKGKGKKDLSEAALIKRAKTGDREAFCELARHYERRLYALALYYARDAHDAEDLSQEVWLKAFRAIGNFRGDASFYTWLRRIAVNTFLNHQREAKTMTVENGLTDNQPLTTDEIERLADAQTPDVEAVLMQRQMVERVSAALGELTAQQRLIFLLKHREGMSGEEIAQVCNVSTGTVKKSLFRAVQKIRERLGIQIEAKEATTLVASKTT
ncbi:MAG: sigma-70 family RNA polymerase sigma factor [Acidobacteriota bacterium]